MNTIRIYLAGAVGNEEDGGRQWREKAVQIFKQASEDSNVRYDAFDPTNFFSYDEAKHQSDTQVKRYYLDQVLHSRIVLVNLDRTKQSPGTAQELQFAIDHEIPIIGFGNEEIYPWLRVDCQCVFNSMLQAIDYIMEYYR